MVMASLFIDFQESRVEQRVEQRWADRKQAL
jgi:hypothetical protein